VIPKSSDLQSELPPAEKGDQREELTPKVTHEPSKPQSLLSRSPAINDQGDVNSNSDKDHVSELLGPCMAVLSFTSVDHY
jgi:hypothetical protein